MEITSLDDLIQVARSQPDPQRLLFVFTRVDAPPPDALPQQHAAYKEGRGGTLTPLACLDKTPYAVAMHRNEIAVACMRQKGYSQESYQKQDPFAPVQLREGLLSQ